MLSRLRDALSFHRTGLRVLWLLHGLDRALLPALVIDSVVRVAATYGSLALTALLVNGLMALEWRACAVAAAGIVALNALAGVVGRVCGYHRQDGAWVS